MRALPLVVAGALVAAAPAWPQSPVRGAAPPALGVTVPGLEPGLVPAKPPGHTFRVGDPAPRLVQLRNRRTGVTCTLRVLVMPTVDSRLLGGTVASADRIVRNDVSPCVE